MSIERSELPGWTRRRFVGAGLATAGAVMLGTRAPGVQARGAAAGGLGADLDDLARKFNGRLLRPGSPLYDEARGVWNKAYDRHPLAMARCADLDDVRRCVELARRRELAVAIRGGGHSYAGFGVADDALQMTRCRSTWRRSTRSKSTPSAASPRSAAVPGSASCSPPRWPRG